MNLPGYCRVGLLLLALCLGLAGCTRNADDSARFVADDWAQLEQQASGQTLRFVMWTGDPSINQFIQQQLKPLLQRDFGIALQVIPGQSEIPNLLLTELEAGRAQSAYDLLWINGENYHQLRQMDALYGPFVEYLPNNRYIDWSNPIIAYDFQQPVDGFEAPWGTTQLLLIGDSQRVGELPQTLPQLTAWIRQHPGRFTFDAGFTGLSFLKSLMYALADDPSQLAGAFNEQHYRLLKQRVFAWVQDVRPYLWRQGKSFPKDVAQLHQLYASGEIDFTMSFNDGEVDNKVASGLFPPSSRAFALNSGMLANSHYLGIVKHSPRKAAAMVAINALISAELQWQKLQPVVWGDGTVLAVDSLPVPWPQRFAELRQRPRAPSRQQLQAVARAEPAPQWMIRLDRDFRDEIIRQ